MLKKKNDLIASPGYKNTLEKYGESTLRMPNGDPVNSPQQAKEMAVQKSGQSWNDKAVDKKAIVMKEFQEGKLHSSSGEKVSNPRQAVAIAYSEQRKQNKDQVRNMSKTVIPSSGPGKIKNPGANQVYVNSRQGGQKEQLMTKHASAKHENPEYFKRQSDRKKNDQFPFQTKEMYQGNKY